MMTTVASVRTLPVLSADNLRCHRNHHGGRRRRCCCCSVVVAAKLFIQGRCPNNNALATGALLRPIISPRYSPKNKALSPRYSSKNDAVCEDIHRTTDAALPNQERCSVRGIRVTTELLPRICSQLLEQQIVSSTFGRCSAKIPRRSRASLTAFGRRSAKIL